MAKHIERMLTLAIVLLALVWGWREIKIRRLQSRIGASVEVKSTAWPTDSVMAVSVKAPGIPAVSHEEKTIPTLIGKSVKVEQTPPDDFLARLMDPKRKNYQKAELVMRLDALYAPLFRCYQMSPTQTAYLKYLIAEKTVVENEYGIRAIKTPAAERAALARECRSLTDKSNAEIRGFLGEEAYSLYEGYDRSLPEREWVKQFKQTIGFGGLSLSYDQEDALIRLMYEERMNAWDIKDLLAAKEPAIAIGCARENARQILRSYDCMVQRIVSRSSPLLDSRLLAVFTNQQAETRMSLEGTIAVINALSDEEIAAAAVGNGI